MYIKDKCSILSHKNIDASKNLYDNSMITTKKYNSINHKYKYYRPPNYGRALVMVDEINNVQLDMKGVGTNKYYIHKNNSNDYILKEYIPSMTSHRTGTFPLGEAIEEYFNEHIFRNAVNHSAIFNKLGLHTLKSYAVIKLNINHKDGTPIAVYVRQATNRYIDLFDNNNKLLISGILSGYGIGTHANSGFYLNTNEFINIQGTQNYSLNNIYNLREKRVYLLDFSGFYYYKNNFFETEVFTHNIITYLVDKTKEKFTMLLIEQFRLKDIINKKNYELLNKISVLLKGKPNLNSKNVLLIYRYIKDFVNSYFIENIENDIISNLIINIKKILGNLSFWFKCSISDCPSMISFSEDESGMYDVRIRRYLLETYGRNRLEADKLNVIICNIRKEFLELVRKCSNIETYEEIDDIAYEITISNQKIIKELEILEIIKTRILETSKIESLFSNS
jgi:hypothetical protein